MPASWRSRSRTTSSRPYHRKRDRHSPTASPTPSLSLSLSPASPISICPKQDPDDPPPPDYPGLPTYVEYKRIEMGYLQGLSPRKRDKALITQAMFDKIWDVLHQPEACTIETPQFRFWVRKMFTLSRPTTDDGWGSGGTRTGEEEDDDDDDPDEEADRALERAMGIARAEDAMPPTAVVLHENRPVAIMEQLYELFCYCHVRAGHGGRDKTCAVIRQRYSWVPKELTAQFVKACPTCAAKRSGGGEPGAARRSRRRAASVRNDRGTPPSPHLVWPPTAGPLDLANEAPCGLRERGARASSGPRMPKEAAALERDLANVPVPASPFGLSGLCYDPLHALGASGTTYYSPPRTRSPALPSLATALSNESLDDNVVLTDIQDDARGEGEGEGRLPPALRPLRLSGSVTVTSETTRAGASVSEDAEMFHGQIDPVLLSFSYPGCDSATGQCVSSSSSSVPGADGVGYPTGAYPSDVRDEMGGAEEDPLRMRDVRVRRTAGAPSPTLATLATPDWDPRVQTPLKHSDWHIARPTTPDREAYRSTSVFKPFDALPSPGIQGSPFCGFGYTYGHGEGDEDGPLATMLLPCSTARSL